MRIRVGAGVPPLGKQLVEHGYQISDPDILAYLQRDIDSIMRLYGNGTMTISEANRCWRRVIKKVVKNMTPVPF